MVCNGLLQPFYTGIFEDIHSSKDMISVKNGFENMINNEYEHYTQLCGPYVGSSDN